MKRFDFYTVAAPVAFVVGLTWVFISMTILKIPGWPAMVGMAAYYAVGGLACHERHRNTSHAMKGLLWGVIVSWLGVFVWSLWFKGNPIAMGVAMGVIAAVCVVSTKWRFWGGRHFEAMPQAFLGATIYFGLFSTFMMAKGVPEGTLLGQIGVLASPGAVQPHVSGVLGILSAVVGVVLGALHQSISLSISGRHGKV